jgi:hypothetical protein
MSTFGFQVSGFGFQVSGFGIRDSCIDFRVLGLRFRVSSFRFRVSDLDLRHMSSRALKGSLICPSLSSAGVDATATTCVLGFGFIIWVSVFLFGSWFYCFGFDFSIQY